MSSERAAPFAPKPPEGWDDHVGVMRSTRMFLLQKKGPTRFVVLKVPPTNPLAWQTSLIDSEVDCILGGGTFGKSNEGRHGVNGGERGASTGIPSPGQHRKFLRRGAGRTSAGGTGGSKGTGDEGVVGEDAEGGGTRRLDIVPGEVCPVCQEEMEENGGSEAVPPIEAAATAAEARLTYCRDGCGNNMHARCMLMYAEHRRSGGEKPCCPLCRVDWGITAVRALREDAQPRVQGAGGGDRSRRRRNGGGGEKGGAATAAVVPVTCRSCSVKVQAVFFRCLVCTPAGSWDLCRRCYAVSGVRRSSHGGGSAPDPCTSVGRNRHSFVQGEAATDPPEWKTAEPPDRGRRRTGRGGGGVARGMLSLQGREITTADFELLLTLDASAVAPLHEHLLQALPPYDGIETDGRDGGLFSTPAVLLRPSVGGQRADRSEGGGIDNDGGNRRFSEILPLDTSTPPSPSVGRATVAPLLSPPPPPSSSVSTVPTPSLAGLVAAAAVARDAAAATTVAAGERREDAAAEVGDAEATSNSGEDPTMPATAVPSFLSEEAAPEEVAPEEVAPVSGSFPSGPVPCSCCSHNDAVRDATSRATESNANAASRTVASARRTEQQQQQQQQQRSSPSSSSPVASFRAPLRRLPCGHSAHEACLIPLILESVGRGDPSLCLCPLDSSPVFPALSRHRRHARRPRPGSDDGVPTSAAVAAAGHDHRRGTRSASSVAPPATVSGGIDRHARAAAARDLLRRNAAAGLGVGGVNAADTLGIALFGSGLAQPPLPPPPSTRRHATARASAAGPRPRESGSTIRTPSAREKGPTLRRGVVNGTEEAENDRGGGGESRGCRNAGRNLGGGAGPRGVSPCGRPRLDSSIALFVGGERIMDATGMEGSAAARGVEDGGGAAARSRRRQRRTPACVVRGLTVGGRTGRRSRSTDRDRSRNEACVPAVSAAGSVDGLALTTLSFHTNGKEGAEESRKAAGHTPLQGEGGDAGGRGSSRGRETRPSLAVGRATAGGAPPGHQSSVGGMALVTAGS